MIKNINTILDIYETSVDKFSQRPLFTCLSGECLSYKGFEERVEVLKFLLRAKGVKKGDKVLLFSENQINWGVAYFAVVTMGAVVVPVMPDLGVEKLRKIVDDVEIDFVFVSQKCFDLNDEFLHELNLPFLLIDEIEICGEGKGVSSVVESNDVAMIVYTSGTSGDMKGVILTHKNIVSNVVSSSICASITSDYRMLSMVPLAHMIECNLGLICPVMAGASVYYLDKELSADVLLSAFKKVRPTLLVGVPLLLEKIYIKNVKPVLNSNRLLKWLGKTEAGTSLLNVVLNRKLKKVFGGELKLFSMGGAKLSREVEEFLKRIKFPFALGYGMTEAAPLVSGPLSAERCFEVPCGSSGKALYGVKIKIEKGGEDNSGEILVKGDNAMKAYYNNQSLSETVFTDDGWFRTGDVGYLNEDNYLFVIGRLDNVIVGSNGRNIYPEEVEMIVNELDFVDESLLSENNGKIVLEVVFDDTGKEKVLLLKEVQDIIMKEFGGILKTCFVVEKVEEFEKTASNKIIRINKKNDELANFIFMVWKKIIKRNDIDIEDSFLDQGVDSLDVVEFHKEVDNKYPGKLMIADIYANPSVRGIASLIGNKK